MLAPHGKATRELAAGIMSPCIYIEHLLEGFGGCAHVAGAPRQQAHQEVRIRIAGLALQNLSAELRGLGELAPGKGLPRPRQRVGVRSRS